MAYSSPAAYTIMVQWHVASNQYPKILEGEANYQKNTHRQPEAFT